MTPQEIPNPWPGHCFGCSPRNVHGLQLRFWRSEGGCFTTCAIPDHLCGWDGLVHGGIIATLLDEISGWTLISQLGKLGVTGKFTIRYIKPVHTNTELRVRGEISKQNRNLVVIRSTIHAADNEEQLLVEGESKWILPEADKLEALTGMDAARLQQFFDQTAQDKEVS
jgi:uncharacterized protein (TIGR00369 family)